MFMNTLQEIPPEELQSFKQKVGTWLKLDAEIAELEKKSRELKKIRNKQLEPEITGFMRQFNISDLNTNNGKIKCNARNTKKAFNQTYIRDNLLKVIFIWFLLYKIFFWNDVLGIIIIWTIIII